MLSQTALVKVKNALAKLYTGTMDVYERTQGTGSHHEVVYTETKVQNAIPCRLSFSSSPVTTGGDVAETVQTVKVFFAPSITISAGSKIVVTQNGVTTAYKHSGKETVYDSHKEVELDLFERWA